MKSRGRVRFKASHVAFEDYIHEHVWTVTVTVECKDFRRPQDGRALQRLVESLISPLLVGDGLLKVLDPHGLATNEGIAWFVADQLERCHGIIPLEVDVWRDTDGLGASWP